jgi:hypothetical protein
MAVGVAARVAEAQTVATPNIATPTIAARTIAMKPTHARTKRAQRIASHDERDSLAAAPSDAVHAGFTFNR